MAMGGMWALVQSVDKAFHLRPSLRLAKANARKAELEADRLRLDIEKMREEMLNSNPRAVTQIENSPEIDQRSELSALIHCDPSHSRFVLRMPTAFGDQLARRGDCHGSARSTDASGAGF